MAKKADLLAQAKELGIKVSEKNTIAEIEKALAENVNGVQTKDVTISNGVEIDDKKTDKPLAKAGKRSAKGIAEAEAKSEKIEKQHHREEAEAEEKESKPKYVQKTRSKLDRAGKKYREAAKKVEKGKEYGAKEALKLATETSTTKFDATVEVHIRLNVDPKQADQNIRETIVLPEGTGKEVRVAVFAEADDVKVAKSAGADVAGSDEFLQQLDKEVIDFDVLIATPAVMPKLGKYARTLGPKGLMPNPKSGTVTTDIESAIKQAKAGKVEFRVDEKGIVHLGVGKVSFGEDRLFKNLQAVFSSLQSARPGSIKGSYVKTIYVTSSMGPSIKVLPSELS